MIATTITQRTPKPRRHPKGRPLPPMERILSVQSVRTVKGQQVVEAMQAWPPWAMDSGREVMTGFYCLTTDGRLGLPRKRRRTEQFLVRFLKVEEVLL